MLYSNFMKIANEIFVTKEFLPLLCILAYMDHISQDSMFQIDLVRKTISDRFFASVFVIRFREDTTQEVSCEVLHKIFRYLDALEWQFTLFDYQSVSSAKVERIENACVYSKQ